MEKNPKTIAGIAGLAVLLVLAVILGTQMFPTNIVGEPTPEPPLHNGSQGEKVRMLQERLKALGYYTDEVDGQFGPGTREAVVTFQQKNGLDADGLAGEETQRVLYSDLAVPNGD